MNKKSLEEIKKLADEVFEIRAGYTNYYDPERNRRLAKLATDRGYASRASMTATIHSIARRYGTSIRELQAAYRPINEGMVHKPSIHVLLNRPLGGGLANAL